MAPGLFGAAFRGGLQREVMTHLVVEILFELIAAKQEAQSAVGVLAWLFQAGWMTRTIAAMTRSNSLISLASCFRPCGVRL